MPRCRLIRVDPEELLALADRIVARAELDGVALEPLDLFDERHARVATAAKIDLAVELERRILAADARMVGLEASDYVDSTSTGSAQRSGHASPGVGPRVAKLVGGAGATPADRILGDIGDGLIVGELSGLHSGVNPVSGDLSVGVEGVRLRGGEPAEPIREVTIGSTLQRMLLEVVAVGDDLTYFPWEATGVTLAIADVTMSGT